MGILTLENVGYTYNSGKTFVFKDLNLSFEKGKMYAITGVSGSGKTTLLALMSGLEKATEGKIYYDNKDISQMDTFRLRCKDMGVIFRNLDLLPYLKPLENVIFSMKIAGVDSTDITKKALSYLEKTGFPADKVRYNLLKLAPEEHLKVAIARAISYDPQMIMADEPTKKLNYKAEEEIIGIFHRLARDYNKCVIVTTQSVDVADSADVVYELKPLVNEKEYVKDKILKFYDFG